MTELLGMGAKVVAHSAVLRGCRLGYHYHRRSKGPPSRSDTIRGAALNTTPSPGHQVHGELASPGPQYTPSPGHQVHGGGKNNICIRGEGRVRK
jgi:hypothetical protein